MKFLKWLAILAVSVPLLLIAGIYVRNKSIGPEGWAVDGTLQKLKSRMKDPDSTVIRSSFIVQKPRANGGTEIFVCGIVDGKNSFGGFTGGVPFASRSVSTENTFDVYDVQLEDREVKASAVRVKMLSGFEKVYWNDWCVDGAHPALTPPK